MVKLLLNGKRTNARGVSILFSKNFEYTLTNIRKDEDGNLLIVDFITNNIKIMLVNVYAPNQDRPDFFENIQNILDENEQDYVLLCGDFNLVLNPSLDSYNYVNINNPMARLKLIQMMHDYQLVDFYRIYHPNSKRFTWRKKNPIKQARLDYFLGNNTLTDLIKTTKIKPGYRSDHSILELNLLINKFVRNKGRWQFNTSLLNDQTYTEIVNKTIKDEILKYLLPVYNIDNFDMLNQSEIQYTISDNLLLEAILLRIRGETIHYSKKLKRGKNNEESDIINQIEILENGNLDQQALETLSDKKARLETIRKDKLKGTMIRSRIQILHEEEKPTKYFCALENKNYVEKTIKKIKLPNGTVITKQDTILEKLSDFYAQLFANKDSTLNVGKTQDIFQTLNANKLTGIQSEKLKGQLTLEEISTSLKSMKNNKTPGIDGFPAEFFKFFWGKLKHVILRAYNYSYDINLLPITLRRSVINMPT